MSILDYDYNASLAHQKTLYEKQEKRAENVEQFEKWLRTVCFQKPTKEAYDLALSAWLEAKQ